MTGLDAFRFLYFPIFFLFLKFYNLEIKNEFIYKDHVAGTLYFQYEKDVLPHNIKKMEIKNQGEVL